MANPVETAAPPLNVGIALDEMVELLKNAQAAYKGYDAMRCGLRENGGTLPVLTMTVAGVRDEPGEQRGDEISCDLNDMDRAAASNVMLPLLNYYLLAVVASVDRAMAIGARIKAAGAADQRMAIR